MHKKVMLAWIVLSLCACTRKQHPVFPPDPPHIPIIELGRFEVMKNQEPWPLEFKLVYWKSDSAFQIQGVQYFSAIKEYLSISDIPLKPGVFSLEFLKNANQIIDHVPQAFVSYTVDGDQGADNYQLDTLRHDHYIEVIRFDTATNAVEGRFQLFLRKRPIAVGLGLPDTLSLTDGRFNIVVEEP